MKKHPLAIWVGILAATALLWTGQAQAGRIHHRMENQEARIERGVEKGALTRGEAVFLEREQARIRKAKRRAWADGRLSRRERLRIERMQDEAGRHIRRLKTNCRLVAPRWAPRHRHARWATPQRPRPWVPPRVQLAFRGIPLPGAWASVHVNIP